MSIDQHTNDQPTTFFQQPAEPAKKPKKQLTPKQKKLRNYGITAVVALGIGALIGGGTTPEPITITEYKTVTETVEKPVLPQSCVRAFQEGEKVMDYYGELGPLASEGVDAAVRLDASRLDATTSKVEALTEKITKQAGVYGGAKGECSNDTDTKIPFNF